MNGISKKWIFVLLTIICLLSTFANAREKAAQECRLIDCEAEGLTEDQCDEFEKTQTRGAVTDANRVMQGKVPENSEVLMPDEKFILWARDETLLKPTEDDEVVFETRVVEDASTVKLNEVVPAVRFDTGSSTIPEQFIEKLRTVLQQMQDRANVRLHVIGHTDDTPLGSGNRALYGDNVGLSEARAQMAAEFFQRSLDLPPEAVSFEGRGDREPITSNATETGRARNRRVEVEVWYDEITEKTVQEEIAKEKDLTQLKICHVVKRCIYKRKVGKYQKVQLINAIAPMRYEGTQLEVTPAVLGQVASALSQVEGMPNVSLRIIGHTDNQPLNGAAERIYGDNLNLSKALANRVARVLQDEFRLRNDAITAIGRGETAPVASNTVASGRAQNRRIEIEIWHDDPRGEEVSEPRACPDAGEAETISVSYRDEKIIIPFAGGQPAYPNGFITRVSRILDTLSKKSNVRINVVGHTTNERLSRRAAVVYQDHFGVSLARAERVAEYLQTELGLDKDQITTEGRGFIEPLLATDDSPFARKSFSLFDDQEADDHAVNLADARVEVEFSYDEIAELQQDPNIEIVPTMQEEQAVSPFALHPIRVSVDGEPVDGTQRHTADVQRCTDVALDQARIQVRQDGLSVQPRLNVQAVPAVVSYWDDPDTREMENKTAFKAYSNYNAYIKRAEVRIFEADQSILLTPLEILPLNEDLYTEWWWIPEVKPFEGPVKELRYVLRVYDAVGNHDETAAKPLWVVNTIVAGDETRLLNSVDEQNVIYGETHLAKQDISLAGAGSVTVTGQNVPLGHNVWVMNQATPVSNAGEFVAEQIIPNGYNTIEVAILDAEGNGSLFLRDLQLKKSDWFTVGIADITLGLDDTEGPASLVTQDTTHYESEFWADGRLAFYTKGKTEGNWTITASGDSKEEPLEDMFNNLDKKDPEAILRRLDPDYYYPTYGDDSTTVEDAPTSGKFYVKAEKNKSYAMWGNFKTEIVDTDLAQIDRALYGADLFYRSTNTNDYGESKLQADLFVAEPGTILGRDEFRGTGGSLYYLQHQDITQGSDRLRIEVRDRDSNIVLQADELVFGRDYDIDYIQGRILLNRPLSSVADDNMLVQDGSISGNPVFLVARYEYSPGFDAIDDTLQGGRVAGWMGEHVKLGTTFSSQTQFDEDQTLQGVDLTLSKTPGTYIKLETARSTGSGYGWSYSGDGGYGFTDFELDQDPDLSASANRVEAAAQLQDLIGTRGRVSLYTQTREAGFSAPGQLTNTEITQSGATVDLPIAERWQLYSKMDTQEREQGLTTKAAEVDVRYRLTDHWRLSTGLRIDEREDTAPVIAETQTQGERSDLALEVMYDSLASWKAYAFAQNTLDYTGNRLENNRAGLGGALRIGNRFTLDAEASGGDGGSGGRLGLDYLATDRTNLYVAYLVDSDRSDTGLRGRNGRSTAGFRTRYSDSLSVYGEERYAFGDQPTGLTHAYGVDIAPYDKWVLGLNMELGTLQDNYTGAETERTAYSFSAGYSSERFNYSGAYEWREDITDSFTRTTTLHKHTMMLKLNPSWRTTLKLNLSNSENTQGTFYDGDFTEIVWGYAFRPINHDRLNMLAKITYFENMPASDQDVNINTRTEYIQRSHIYSLDTMYDVTQRWTVGFKYGLRIGEVALDRSNPNFFSSNADLTILRADWHVVNRWDLVVEGRQLVVEEAQDSRTGFLVGCYRHVGKNMKLGVGYNFTDFSDDLTDLDYDSKGFFINIIGKM
ncbi:MAG: OmpA family protein [Gammaproteobacteria bacterium]|nr:OmpA family protein [Gammaproteobacteria bacterium]